MPGGPPPLPLIEMPAWIAGRKPGGGGGSGSGGGGGAGGGGSVKVPPELKKGLEDAWKDSFPSGKSQEQAGVLVKKADGSLEWKRVVHGTSGTLTGGTFTIDYSVLVGKGETLVAAAHTHPYDASEGGHKDVSFSGADFARLTVVPEPQHYVKAGDSVFMISRTAAFDALVKKEGAAKVAGDINTTWNTTFAGTKGTIQEKAEKATKAVAQKYGFDYYSGKGDTLNKVDTTK